MIEIGTLGRPPGPPHRPGPRPGPRPRRLGRTVVIGGGYWPGYPYDRDVEVFTPAVAIRWRVEVTGARQRYYEAPTLGQALRSVPGGARVVGAQRWNGAGWAEV